MKRGQPLKRKTALKAKTPLKASRTTLAARNPLQATRTRIKPISDARRAEKPARDEVRAKVFARDWHRCQFPHRGYPAVPCMGGLTFGHIVRAGQGGSYTTDNGVTLCAVSNSWLADHPVAARALGLERRRWAP